jgi:hypothetical protein
VSGRYRVIYEIRDSELIIRVVRIAHRSKAYRILWNNAVEGTERGATPSLFHPVHPPTGRSEQSRTRSRAARPDGTERAARPAGGTPTSQLSDAGNVAYPLMGSGP